jgi:hypothetical protein
MGIDDGWRVAAVGYAVPQVRFDGEVARADEPDRNKGRDLLE